MHMSVKDSLKRLNGTITATTRTPLLKGVSSIKINSPLFDRYWQDNVDIESSLEGLCWKHKKLLENDSKAFRKKLKVYIESEIHHIAWTSRHFTPFTTGTKDFKAWSSGPNKLSLDGIKSVIDLVGSVKNDEYEFIEIPTVGGDSCLISLQDPNPSNPTIFSTERGSFFNPVHVSKFVFSEFLDTLVSAEEVLDDVERQCNEIYTQEIESFVADEADDEEYEDIEIYEDDIENLFVEVENSLVKIDNLSDAKRKSIATAIVKSFCHLLDEKVGTELEKSVKKIAKEIY